jgi:hypothetical protein
MSVYILEIKAVFLRDKGAVGYGFDERGREYVVPLDRGLASDIATALAGGRRPIVVAEKPDTPYLQDAGRRRARGAAKRCSRSANLAATTDAL